MMSKINTNCYGRATSLVWKQQSLGVKPCVTDLAIEEKQSLRT